VIAPPPALADLRYGTQLRAGLGVSTVLADCDFETYSEAGYQWDAAKGRWGPLPHATKRGIQAVGAFRYAEHPTTEVLCFGYDLKDGLGRRQWRPGVPFPDDLRQHIADGKLLEAWNVQFEMAIWEAVCVPRLGWPAVPRSQWRCAMGKARAFALPGKLEEAAKVLGTAAQKMTDGKRLLNLFSVPRNPTKDDPRLRRRPEEDRAGDGQRLYYYNLGDIETEAEISSRVPDLEGEELEWWHVDLDINARGVHLDMPSVEGCAAIVETALAKYNTELATLTGGAVESASQVQRLRDWMASRGYSVTSLDEEHLTYALKDPTLPPDCLRPLQIRELIGSASVKKLFSMRNQVCADGNLRGLFKYHAARTGRTTGADVQPTNLPSGGPPVRACGACGQHYGKSKPACPWCFASAETSKIEGWSHRAADDALLVARSGSLAAFEMFFDDALPTISGCLRGLFVARPGHELICSDYSAIEAVALAELAGEEWRKEVFRGHGKIYEASAAKTFGVPLDDILRHKKETGDHHPIRKKGKVLELALGYGGWVGALVAFGADEFMTEDEMRAAAGDWRVESPAIVDYWGGQSRYDRRVHVRYPELFGIEGAALNAIRSPGTEYSCRGIRFLVSQDVLYCTLLSGRRLTYHKPRLRPSDRRSDEETLSYEGWNTNPKNGPVGWIRIDTYGPKLVENVDQATCRDIQRHGLIKLHRAGYPTVLHVYDENVGEVPEGSGFVEEYEMIMAELPEWCRGWPIRAAGGWRGRRYRKD
jgi:DNA polymerase